MLSLVVIVYVTWFLMISFAKKLTMEFCVNIRDTCIFPKLLYYSIASVRGQKIIEKILKYERYFDDKLMKHMIRILLVIVVIDFWQDISATIVANIVLLLLICMIGLNNKERFLLNSIVINSVPLLVMIDMVFRTTMIAANNIIQGNEINYFIVVLFLIVNMMIAVVIGIKWCWDFIKYYFIIDKIKRKIVYITMLSLHMMIIMIGFGVTDIMCDKEYRIQAVKQVSNYNIIEWTGWAVSHAVLPIINETEDMKKLIDGNSDNVHVKTDSYMREKGIFVVETGFVIFVIYVYTQILSGV